MNMSLSNYRAGAMVGDQGYPAWELLQILSAIRRLFGEQAHSDVCARLGVAPEVLGHITLVPVWQVDGAMEALCALTDDREIGMRAAADYRVSELGFLKGHLARCQTLADCFYLLNDNPEWAGTMNDSLVTLTDGKLRVRWINTLRIPDNQFHCHFLHSLGALVVLGRELCGQAFPLGSIALTEASHPCAFIESLCGVTPSFNAPFCEWTVDAVVLALPVSYAFSDEERREPELIQPSYIYQVLQQLKISMPLLPTLNELAARLGTSERTLRRKLAENGCNFQLLRDKVRSQAAIALIIEGRLSAEDIAESLGFTDVSHFRASFKHWLGAPPGKFQRLVAGYPTTDSYPPTGPSSLSSD